MQMFLHKRDVLSQSEFISKGMAKGMQRSFRLRGQHNDQSTGLASCTRMQGTEVQIPMKY